MYKYIVNDCSCVNKLPSVNRKSLSSYSIYAMPRRPCSENTYIDRYANSPTNMTTLMQVRTYMYSVYLLNYYLYGNTYNIQFKKIGLLS